MTNEKRNSKNVLSSLLKILAVLVLLVFIICVVKTCMDCREYHTITLIDQTGYLPDKEDWDVIPDVEPPYDDDELDSLPEAVSLEHLFPPIGNQGPYGTCVAWSSGYNLKTALNAIDNHWTAKELADPANQTSPKDLWLGIPSNEKGAFCGGTAFSSALTVLKNQGAASMKEVPYANLGTCSGNNIKGDMSNRIGSFQHVVSGGSLPSIKQIKSYIRDTVPLLFAADVGDVFTNWHSDKAFDLHENGETEGHAMVLVGYDDSRHAFRIRNSWGVTWGDNGSAWVDYDHFMNDFCCEVFVMSNEPQPMPVASHK